MNMFGGIGAMADVTAIFYLELVKDGLDEGVAMILTEKFIEALMTGSLMPKERDHD